MHRHARNWRRPPYFERLVWDYDGAVGPRGNWGDWRDGPAMTRERLTILERAADLLARRLERFGKGPERFGLIHADLRLANLLVTADDTRVIDFDDSGLGWFLYDLASAMSFMEERDDLEELIEAWVTGYREEAPLSAEDEAEIPSFLMLRRLAIVAWIGSHADTDLARQLGPEFTAGSVRVAERFLDRCGP
jgi:Ser/Thr protein kinase RdoA (MazF antagonist)